jgi:hypothetical protein
MPGGGGIALKVTMVAINVVDGGCGGCGNVGVGDGRWCDVVTSIGNGDGEGGD